MKRASMVVVFAAAVLLAGCSRQTKAPESAGSAATQQAEPKVVRAAVIGGMTMTGMWDEVARMFEAETGYKVKVAVTGPRPVLAKAFKEGQADLLTMHSGDITTDLVADGYGMNMRPWTRNDLVIAGPQSDPAGIRGLTDAAEAFRRIAQAKANFIDFEGIGSREVCHKIWQKAGVPREGAWVIKDESNGHLDILNFARQHNAYVVVGRMPVLFEKMKADDMTILLDGDQAMQRPYVVMEANPEKLPNVNSKGARALADFLLSDKTQQFLTKFGARNTGDKPLFYPLKLTSARQ